MTHRYRPEPPNATSLTPELVPLLLRGLVSGVLGATLLAHADSRRSAPIIGSGCQRRPVSELPSRSHAVA